MNAPLKIAFFGSSLVSYHRGLLRALSLRGHTIDFYDPESYTDDERLVSRMIETASAAADVIVKTSGTGPCDDLIEAGIIACKRSSTITVFWDLDAPATLARVMSNVSDTFRHLIPRYDFIFTRGGGQRVITAYRGLGARACVPIYDGIDPTTHHPDEPRERFASDLSLLTDRTSTDDARTDELFFSVARELPTKRFLLGGGGWSDKTIPANVHYVGHVFAHDHNAFDVSALAVLGDVQARIFEAAGTGACVIADEWEGIEDFFAPGREILVAHRGHEVATQLEELTAPRALEIGAAARARVLRDHTYAHRAAQVERALLGEPLRHVASP